MENAENTNKEAKLVEKGVRSGGLRKQIAEHYQRFLSGFSRQIIIKMCQLNWGINSRPINHLNFVHRMAGGSWQYGSYSL